MVLMKEFFDDFEEEKSEDDRTHENLPSMQIVKSSCCKVSLGLFVGDCTRAILLV